ncbi:hypothetical protein BCR32DRAFT_294788 [Anaeromyces robustus]|uniref:Uncharacterized protein n=1 Tax=Anaeromyces robustus TaxID=1754192 RepID=A0A1Y1WZR0_9FUNG|nr:hypothetical protein BCR32DRAFT_294788 [Anaeromyces robustus]|eukprot:ORX78875.1 hypothetical protein BCR32DRAFT_294788 [Anaeromyces robustus]
MTDKYYYNNFDNYDNYGYNYIKTDNVNVNVKSTPLTFGKIALYGVEIVFLIQLLMVILNYSRDWKNKQSNNSNSELSSNNDISDSSPLNSSESEYESSLSSINEKLESSLTIKKILTFISVLPLSSFYLVLKLSYHIMKIIVYTLFDLVINFVNYWILNFPERFEEIIVNFFSNYIFRSISYISEKFIIPTFSYLFNVTKNYLNDIFCEENYDKAVYYIGRSAEFTYDKVIIPCSEKTKKFSINFFNGLWNFLKESTDKIYDWGQLLLNTLTLFTLDFFEDVQVAWSGIQWFGINIAQPAASFLEDVLLTLTIRPLAYAVAFSKVLLEKLVKAIYKLCIAFILVLPSLISMVSIYTYKTFNLASVKHTIHVWMCRWVYLPIWYVVYFLVNYGEKLVVEYIPTAYHAFLRFGSYVLSKLGKLLELGWTYLKIGSIYGFQYTDKFLKFLVEYIPYAHKRSMSLSKKVYHWLKENVFPYVDTLYYMFYEIPMNISKRLYIFLKIYVYSEDSFIGKNSRVVMRTSKHLGEVTFSHMIQIGQSMKTFTMNMLKVIMPHVLEVSKKIMNLSYDIMVKFFNVLKPICQKEIEVITYWTEKGFQQLSIAIKQFLKELKFKIDENTTLIYQAIVKENKKLHQSYESKKEFNKEFLKKKD